MSIIRASSIAGGEADGDARLAQNHCQRQEAISLPRESRKMILLAGGSLCQPGGPVTHLPWPPVTLIGRRGPPRCSRTRALAHEMLKVVSACTAGARRRLALPPAALPSPSPSQAACCSAATHARAWKSVRHLASCPWFCTPLDTQASSRSQASLPCARTCVRVWWCMCCTM